MYILITLTCIKIAACSRYTAIAFTRLQFKCVIIDYYNEEGYAEPFTKSSLLDSFLLIICMQLEFLFNTLC